MGDHAATMSTALRVWRLFLISLLLLTGSLSTGYTPSSCHGHSYRGGCGGSGARPAAGILIISELCGAPKDDGGDGGDDDGKKGYHSTPTTTTTTTSIGRRRSYRRPPVPTTTTTVKVAVVEQHQPKVQVVRHRERSNQKEMIKIDDDSQQQQQQSHYFAINEKLIKAESYEEILQIVQPYIIHYAAGSGGSSSSLKLGLNLVNLTTALHRLTRHCVNNNSNANIHGQQQQQHHHHHHHPSKDTTTTTTGTTPTVTFEQKRNRILADPRFALLVCSAAESLLLSAGPKNDADETKEGTKNRHDNNYKNSKNRQQTRHCSNMAWSLVKLKVPPPRSAMPVSTTTTNDHEQQQQAAGDTNTTTTTTLLLLATAKSVRQELYRYAQDRRQSGRAVDADDGGGGGGVGRDKRWVPELSKLAGHFLDHVGGLVLRDPDFAGTWHESSNLLWSFASADRASPAVFGKIVDKVFAARPSSLRVAATTSPAAQQPSPPVPAVKPQEWSNSIWAFATAGIYERHDVLLSCFANYLSEMPTSTVLTEFKSQEIANTIWGVATIIANAKDAITGSRDFTDQEARDALYIVRRLVAEVVRRRAGGFRSQELANIAWALATIGFGLDANSSGTNNIRQQQYLVLDSDEKETDRRLLLQCIDVIVDQSKGLVEKFRSQELNNLSWALGRMFRYDKEYHQDNSPLKHHIEELFGRMASAFSYPRRQVMGNDISSTVWGMAALGYRQEVSYRKILSRFSIDNAHLYQPQDLSNSVWALATAEFDIIDKTCFDNNDANNAKNDIVGEVVDEKKRASIIRKDSFTMVLHMAAQELIRRPSEFRMQEIKDVLWGFASLGVRHPVLFKAMAVHTVGPVTVPYPERARTFDEFTSHGLGNFAWTFARHSQLVGSNSNNKSAAAANDGKLASYRASCTDLGQTLVRKLFAVLANTAVAKYDNLRNLSAQDISNLAWALAVQGLKHEPYINAAIKIFAERRTIEASRSGSGNFAFAGQETGLLFWAAAIMNVPSGDLVDAGCKHLVAQSNGGGKFFAGAELGSMAWACSVFDVYPDFLISNIYNGALGNGNNKGPIEAKLSTTLITTQIAMTIRTKSPKYRLPDDFPTAWVNESSLRFSEDSAGVTTNTIQNVISTSNIQRFISSTLHSIGFDHVDEFGITMQDLVEQYGLSIPAQPIQVFSLDMAVPEKKIAIEVDGPTHFVTRIDGSLPKPCDDSKQFNTRKDGTLDIVFDFDGEQQEANGATVLKHRLLTDLGWKIAHIPFWEWTRCNSDEERRKVCLQAIRDVGVNTDNLLLN